jgi:hypothetical protein
MYGHLITLLNLPYLLGILIDEGQTVIACEGVDPRRKIVLNITLRV